MQSYNLFIWILFWSVFLCNCENGQND